MIDTGHWLSNLQEIGSFYGFVYIIENKLNNRKYIGKKNFFHRNGKENNWKKYRSSCKILKNDIKLYGEENFIFTMLECYNDSKSLENAEIELQLSKDVLKSRLSTGIREYYNGNIHRIGFAADGLTRSAKHRAAISKAQKGRTKNGTPCTPARKNGISKANTGKIRSKSVKDSMSKERKNKPQTENRLLAVENQKDQTIYKWFHADYGIIAGSKHDMLRNYENLTKIGLDHVIYGYQPRHRGWSIHR